MITLKINVRVFGSLKGYRLLCSMRTIEKIREELESIRAGSWPEGKERKRQQKKCKFLEEAMINMMMPHVNEDYIIKEKRRLEGIIEAKHKNYGHWLKTDYKIALHGKAPKTAFNKYLGIPRMRKQLKLLSFFLQDDGDKWSP